MYNYVMLVGKCVDRTETSIVIEVGYRCQVEHQVISCKLPEKFNSLIDKNFVGRRCGIKGHLKYLDTGDGSLELNVIVDTIRVNDEFGKEAK